MLAVNQLSDQMQAIAETWPTLDALMGGTPAMRKAGRLLPQWPAETDEAYRARLATATLYPAYRRTVNVMAGKPFAKALSLTDADPRIVKWCEDVDMQGCNLHTFASEMFEDAFFGLCGILIDYPRTDGQPITFATAEANGIRPYFVRVYHNQILGWRTETIGGRTVLSQVRIMENAIVPDGTFGTKTVQRVRVLERGSWQLWENVSDTWRVIDEGVTSLQMIPFVPLYGHRTGFMAGSPPLEDLAYLNVKHWQSQSDQDTIMHAARVPILCMTGADDDSQLTIGGSQAVKLPLGADLKWVEHSGSAIGAGAESIAALEDQMIQTGAELLVKQPGQRTATESANDAEANKSALQRMAEGFEDAIDQALVFMAAYGNIPAERAGNVSLFKDYGAATLSDASAQLVLELQGRGMLSRYTTLAEMKRRGILEASTDVEDELERADNEAPALGTIE